MDIATEFERMGARAKEFARRAPGQRNWNGVGLRGRQPTLLEIDIARDEQGAYFSLTHSRDVQLAILDVRPADRHLLLQAAWPESHRSGEYLCGHDEREWFVAAIPESAQAMTVQDAKDALKPQAVWDAIEAYGVPMEDRDLRRTAAFVRQGEWFFIPRPDARIREDRVVRCEPIRRGGGKPHTCQFLYRYGGEQVYVSDEHPNGITKKQYLNWPRADRNRQDWKQMWRNAAVFVRGAIMHSDHETIWLDEWHEVVMNRETESAAMRDLAFLD